MSQTCDVDQYESIKLATHILRNKVYRNYHYVDIYKHTHTDFMVDEKCTDMFVSRYMSRACDSRDGSLYISISHLISAAYRIV